MTQEQQRKEERSRSRAGAKPEEQPSEESAELLESSKGAEISAGATEEQALEENGRRIRRLPAERWIRTLRASIPRWRTLRHTLARRPPLDVIDRDGEIVVRADVPGMAKEQLDVVVTGGTLSIRGHVEPQTADQAGQYRRHELTRPSFERRLRLPCEVQADRASGSIQNGVLELVLPKSPRARPHSITIR